MQDRTSDDYISPNNLMDMHGDNWPKHKPEPNDSGSSSRTSGSLAAQRTEERETAVNSPPFSGRVEAVLSQTGVFPCRYCNTAPFETQYERYQHEYDKH